MADDHPESGTESNYEEDSNQSDQMESSPGREDNGKSEDDNSSADTASEEEMHSQGDEVDDDDDVVASKSSCSTYVSDEMPGVIFDLRNRTFRVLPKIKLRGYVLAVIGIQGKLLIFKSNKTCDVYDIETNM